MRRSRRNFAARIEVEKLDGHLLNCRASLVALRLPAFSAECVEARRRCLGCDVVGGAIALDLVDAIERDIEAVAALVLDYGDFNRALLNEHLLDAAINTDAVLEMDDEISGLERRKRLDG